MANLFPEGYENEVVSDLATDTVIGYKNGMAFDDVLGDFIRDGKNKVIDNSGVESWKNWIVNSVSTQRYSCLACSSDIGIDLDAVIKAGSREEAENILAREVTECAMADPYGRTKAVLELSIEWVAPDGVEVKGTLLGIDETTIDFAAYISLV